MQEATVRYQEEGFSRIYVACAGTNTKKLIDLLETMFGDQGEPDLEGLESEAMKEMQEEAATAKEADIAATEGPTLSGNITRMVVTSLPVPLEFGLQPKMYPETESVKEPSKKILPKGLPNSITGVADAHTHLRTNQACTPTPDDALTLN